MGLNSVMQFRRFFWLCTSQRIHIDSRVSWEVCKQWVNVKSPESRYPQCPKSKKWTNSNSQKTSETHSIADLNFCPHSPYKLRQSHRVSRQMRAGSLQNNSRISPHGYTWLEGPSQPPALFMPRLIFPRTDTMARKRPQIWGQVDAPKAFLASIQI